MVEVTFLGHSGVRIRGKKVAIVCDPPAGEILGITTPAKVGADIVLLTQKEVPAHSNLAIVQPANGQIFEIEGPGEYEISQTEILGLPAVSKGSCFSDSTKLTTYQIQIDGISAVFLGTISKLTQNIVEQLSSVDILFLPVGGKVSVEPKEAVSVITTLEPAIVVPVHYFKQQLSASSAYAAQEKDSLGTLDQFLAQVGKIPTEVTDKLQITKDKLPEEVKIVVLKTVGDKGIGA